MNDPTDATTCLHALLGDEMHALPPGFLPKLDRFLAEGHALLEASNRTNIRRGHHPRVVDCCAQVDVLFESSGGRRWCVDSPLTRLDPRRS